MSKEDKSDFYNIAGEAVEKQIQKKPLGRPYTQEECDSGTDYLCPECKLVVGAYSDDMQEWVFRQNYCDDCGQKLNWEA